MIFGETSYGKLVKLKAGAGAKITPFVGSGAVGNEPVVPTYEAQSAIITRVQLTQETSHQFLHAFGNKVYIYVFGDRLGGLVLSGICAGSCPDGQAVTGAAQMLAHYKTHKLSARPAPHVITIANTAFRAYLGGLSMDTIGPGEQIGGQLVQFQMRLFVLPGAP